MIYEGRLIKYLCLAKRDTTLFKILLIDLDTLCKRTTGKKCGCAVKIWRRMLAMSISMEWNDCLKNFTVKGFSFHDNNLISPFFGCQKSFKKWVAHPVPQLLTIPKLYFSKKSELLDKKNLKFGVLCQKKGHYRL